MSGDRDRRGVSATVVAVLAILQGLLGLLRSAETFRLGIDLGQRGVLLLPLFGALAMASSGLMALVAGLYLAFAVGALRRRAWSRGVGLAAAAINGLLVVNALVQGAAPIPALLWAVVPVIVAVHLLAPARR